MNIFYIISQIITVLMFIFLGVSFYFKDRKKILLANIFAQICQIVSTLLLKGFTGALMSIIMLLSYNTMYADYMFNRKENKIRNVMILLIYFILIIFVTSLSFNGYASIIAALATIILLFGLWQRNLKIYKICGIIGSILWLIYYNYLKSIFGVVLEIILIISTLISYMKNK